MKTITLFLIIASLVLSLMAGNSFQERGLINNRIRKTGEKITLLTLEYKGLSKYKDKSPIALTTLYLDVFNEIKVISGYYDLIPLVKIPGANDAVNIEQFFKTSAYKGIRYVDILCEVNFKDALDEHLLGMFCAMIKTRPVSLLEIKMEKGALTLTMRLYGL